MTVAVDARALRRNVFLISVMMFAFTMFQGLVNAMVPLRMADLAMSKAAVGIVQAIPGVFAILFGPPIARLANTRWRRGTIVTGFACCLAACLFYSSAGSVAALVVPQALMGLASATFWALALSTTFQLASGSRQHQIQAIITACQGIGYFLGPLVGGYLSQIRYAYGFYAGALASTIGLLATSRLPSSPTLEPSQGLVRDFLGAYVRLYRVLTRRPTVLLGAVFVFISVFLVFVMGGSFFLLYAHQIGLTVMVAAATVSTREVVASLARLGFSLITRRIQPVVLLGVGTIVGSLALALLPLAGSAVSVAVVGIVMGVFVSFVPPAVNVLSGASAAPHEQSFAIISLNLSNFTAQTTLAPLLGLFLSRAGYAVVYPTVGLLWAVLSAVVFTAGLRIVAWQNRQVQRAEFESMPCQ